MKVRKEGLAGFAGVALVAVTGYFALISPQQSATADLRDQAAAVEQSNQGMSSQLPALKAQLGTISGSVSALREVAAQIPAKLDVPDLYAELADAAAAAGLPATDISPTVSPPMLITATGATSPDPDAGDAGEGADTSSGAAGTTTESATIASYEVSMAVKGSLSQVIAFLNALDDAPRLSVIGSSSVTVSDGEASLNIRALYFLQKVDVEGLAQQIEALTAGGTSDPADIPGSDAAVVDPAEQPEVQPAP